MDPRPPPPLVFNETLACGPTTEGSWLGLQSKRPLEAAEAAVGMSLKSSLVGLGAKPEKKSQEIS